MVNDRGNIATANCGYRYFSPLDVLYTAPTIVRFLFFVSKTCIATRRTDDMSEAPALIMKKLDRNEADSCSEQTEDC
jgi:hypothetical protein